MSLFCQSESSLRRWKLFVDVGTDCWVLNVPWMFHILHFDKCPICIPIFSSHPHILPRAAATERPGATGAHLGPFSGHVRSDLCSEKKKLCILSKRSSFAKILIILNLCSWCSWQLLWKFMGSPSSDIKSLFLVFPNQVGTAAFWKALSALSAVWKIIWMHGSIVGLPKSMQASDFKDSGREFMWIQTSYVYKLQTGNCPSRGKKWHLENQDFALWICHS